MASYGTLGANTAAAKRALRREIQAALDEINELARRAMSADKHFNRAYLVKVRAQLRDLAEQRGLEITAGKYSDLLEKTLRLGVKQVKGATFGDIDPRIFDFAMNNSEVDILGILDDGVKIVNREMLKATMGNASVIEVADTLREKLDLGVPGGITQGRADLIAGSELHSVYRQAQIAAGEAQGFEYYRYEGPDDNRTEPICEQYLALGAMTLEQWQEQVESDGIDWGVFLRYAAHYGCRHDLIPTVAPSET